MPPGKKLPDEQIAALRAWIEDGAPMPVAGSLPRKDEKAQSSTRENGGAADQGRGASFGPFALPSVQLCPTVVAANPIDAFLRQAISSRRFEAFPPADKRTLIRRAYLDITGLPPTPPGQRVCERSSPKAFSKVVENAFASPHYGERWGRHWLDWFVMPIPAVLNTIATATAWRYRDYVIRASIRTSRTTGFSKSRSPAMRSGRIPAERVSRTGYLRLGLENNLKNEQTRLDELDDLVTTTSNTFLGRHCRLRSLPQPQVRPHSAEGLLPHAGGLLSRQGV